MFGKEWNFAAPLLVYPLTWTQVKVMVRPTVQSASLSWNKVPIWGVRPDLYYRQTVAGLLIRGALSDENGSVVCQTQSAVIRLLTVCKICISLVQFIKFMYIQHIRGLCQFKLSTADHALLLVAPVTTVVYSLERSYD
jgi:hypothetical protein